MHPYASVKRKKGGSNQKIYSMLGHLRSVSCKRRPTEGFFHQGRPRISASPIHSGAPSSLRLDMLPRLLPPSSLNSGASSSVSGLGELVPDLSGPS